MFSLKRHAYRYFPYEITLANREAKAAFPGAKVRAAADGLRISGALKPRSAERLVYFSEAIEGDRVVRTIQSRLERSSHNSPSKQATRYSVHGLHEYKGKFNPQIARVISNVLGLPERSHVIDPFCGSGTTLVECEHAGLTATGLDINPLAIFVANAKLGALSTPASVLSRGLRVTLRAISDFRGSQLTTEDERLSYLRSWFTPDVLQEIEAVKNAIRSAGARSAPVLMALASNLLRDYSLQDPKDLRIRRRKSPLPIVPFVDAFEKSASSFISKLSASQEVIGIRDATSRALLTDCRSVKQLKGVARRKFDCAITSPPYATALPYIDTQRLSLVWLGLISPSEILPLEATLIGSREVRGGASKRELLAQLANNGARLPKRQAEYCQQLLASIGTSDGFRRQAVPLLLYKYFTEMTQMFQALRPLMKADAPFALIVGGNHTVLGGARFDIDTPAHLGELARANGWRHEETVPLQTYQRFGYHRGNAVISESMLIVRAQ
jgi:hypothetical protein